MHVAPVQYCPQTHMLILELPVLVVYLQTPKIGRHKTADGSTATATSATTTTATTAVADVQFEREETARCTAANQLRQTLLTALQSPQQPATALTFTAKIGNMLAVVLTYLALYQGARAAAGCASAIGLSATQVSNMQQHTITAHNTDSHYYVWLMCDLSA
jgi:hypothetical protein